MPQPGNEAGQNLSTMDLWKEWRASSGRLEKLLGSLHDTGQVEEKAARAATDEAATQQVNAELAKARRVVDELARRPDASARMGQSVGGVENDLRAWERAMSGALANGEVGRDLREHLVVDQGAFKPEDATSPARVAEAFATLGRKHLLRTKTKSSDGLGCVWRFAPRGMVAQRPCAPVAEPVRYFFHLGNGPNVVDFEPFVQTELPLGTPILAWNLVGKDEFVAVTPDGGRYIARAFLFVNNSRKSTVERGGGFDGFVPLQNGGVTFQDLVAGVGDVPPSTRSGLEATRTTALACHERIDASFEPKLDKLRSLHEDLVRRGVVAQSVWDQISNLKEQRERAHETGCKGEEKQLVAAVVNAQSEYVAARKKCWDKVSGAKATAER